MSTVNRSTNTLDLYRVVAILMVMTVHCGQYVFPKGTIAYDVAHFGLYGVPVFFALSGYLAIKSANRGLKTKEYYIKRLVRILPAYYVCLLITGSVVRMPIDDTSLGWLRYFLFLNLFIPSSDQEWVNINGYWCMPVFMCFYLLVPFIYRWINTLKRNLCLCVISIAVGLFALYTLQNEGMPHIGMPVFFESLPCFLVGGVIPYVCPNNKVKTTLFFLSIFVILLCIMPETYILWSIGTGLLILWHNKPIINKYISSLVSFLANISFNLYLVHMMVLRLLCEYGLTARYFVLLFLVISFISATLMYYLIDKHTSYFLKIFKYK